MTEIVRFREALSSRRLDELRTAWAATPPPRTADLSFPGAAPHLARLAVTDAAGQRSATGLAEAPGLRALDLSFCPLLKDLAALARLRELRLDGSLWLDDLAPLLALPSLAEVSIRELGVDRPLRSRLEKRGVAVLR